jgi:hypothetical protein
MNQKILGLLRNDFKKLDLIDLIKILSTYE